MKDLRDAFFDTIFDIACLDKNVIVITDDMGAFSLETFKKKLPKQFINIGIAEQNMIGVAAGLAMNGKKVYCYGIASFMTARCFEQIKIDLCLMNLPVVIVTVGGGYTYGSDGPTHHAPIDISMIRLLPEMSILSPCDSVSTEACARASYRYDKPMYVRIERGKLPCIYAQMDNPIDSAIYNLKQGSDITIISTGYMSHKCIETVNLLDSSGIKAALYDMVCIAPVNKTALFNIIDASKKIVTVEEGYITGGLGSLISDFMADNCLNKPLLRIGAPHPHIVECGDRDWILSRMGLDNDTIVQRIKKWILG